MAIDNGHKVNTLPYGAVLVDTIVITVVTTVATTEFTLQLPLARCDAAINAL